MSYSIEFKASAKKELEALPVSVQEKILQSLQLVSVQPFSPILPIRKMQTKREDCYRLRMGNYRVVYEVIRQRLVIHIIRVGHRKDVYR